MPSTDRDSVKPYHGAQGGARTHAAQVPARLVANQVKSGVTAGREPARQSPPAKRGTI